MVSVCIIPVPCLEQNHTSKSHGHADQTQIHYISIIPNFNEDQTVVSSICPPNVSQSDLEYPSLLYVNPPLSY